jgi:chromosome segregation ATPase
MYDQLESVKLELSGQVGRSISRDGIQSQVESSKQDRESLQVAFDEARELLKAEQLQVKSLQMNYEEALVLVENELKKSRTQRSEMDSLVEENKRLQSRMHLKPSDASDQMNLKDLESRNADLEKMVSVEKEKVASLEKSQKETSAFRDAESRQNRIYRKEMERLTEDNKRMKGLEVHLGTTSQTIASLELKLSVLKNKSHQEKSKVTALETERSKLQTTLESEKTTSSHLRASLDQAELKAVELKDYCDKKKDENAVLEERYSKLKSDAKVKLDEGETKNNEYEIEVKSLKETIKSKQTNLEVLKQIHDHTIETLEATSNVVVSLKEENKQISELNKKIDALDMTLMEKESQLLTEQNRVADLTSEHNNIMRTLTSAMGERKKLDEKLAEMEVTFEAEVAKKKALEETFNNERKAHATETKYSVGLSQEQRRLEDEVATLKYNLESEATKNTVLQQSITAISESKMQLEVFKDAELEKKEYTILQNKETIETLKMIQSEYEQEKDRSKDVESEVSRLNNYLGSMKISIDELHESLEESQAELNEMSEQNKSFRKENETLEHDLKTLQKEHEQVLATNTPTQGTIKKLMVTLEKKETVLDSKQEIITKLQEEVNETAREFDEQKSTSLEMNKGIVVENEKLRKSIDKMNRRLEEIKNSSQKVINDLEQSLAKKDLCLTEKNAMITSLENQVDVSEVQKTKETKTLESLKYDDFLSTKKQISEAKAAFEAEKLKVVNLKALKSTSQKIIQDLEASLDKKESTLSEKEVEIATLRMELAETLKIYEREKNKTEKMKEKITSTKSQTTFDELNSREKIAQKTDPTRQKIKLRDLLLVSGAFHNGTMPSTPIGSPRGRSNPEDPWGSRM